MFQTPALIVMSIAATRMYRSLAGFTSFSEYYSSRPLRSVLMLTTADIAGLSTPLRFRVGAR
jgi:hypothetical protein